MRKGFTLVELMVVVAIIGVLLSVLLPSLSRVREQAKVVAVNAELRQIGICIEMYMGDNGGKYPPTRQDCTMGWEDHQLPPELVESGYLARPKAGSGMSAGIEDRFNRGHTYKYWAVGELYQNGRLMERKKASLYVPVGFPGPEGPVETDVRYDDPVKSPVSWVIFSTGPKFDEWEAIKCLHGPVARRTWYEPRKHKGLIVRMRLKKGRHIGSFAENP